MREEHLAGVGGVHVPVLGGGVEADVRGPDDLESPERAEINRFGVEAADVAAGIEAEGGVHGLWALIASSKLLVVGLAVGLPPEVRFAGALSGFPERLLDGLGRGFAAFALEAIGLDGDLAEGRNADVDAAGTHSAPPSKVSRTLPSCSCRRWTRSPRVRASRIVLWMP
jgi:hypothetical protein